MEVLWCLESFFTIIWLTISSISAMKSLEERHFSLPIALYKACNAMSKQGKLSTLKEKKKQKRINSMILCSINYLFS